MRTAPMRSRPRPSAPRQNPRWEYEPEPEELLARLIPEYVDDLGLPGAARSPPPSSSGRDDRDAQRRRERGNDNGRPDPEMNRVRQAEITQEILEVVAGAEALG